MSPPPNGLPRPYSTKLVSLHGVSCCTVSLTFIAFFTRLEPRQGPVWLSLVAVLLMPREASGTWQVSTSCLANEKNNAHAQERKNAENNA